MAIDLDTYFSDPTRQKEGSGTREFMLHPLTIANMLNEPYLQSPLDDFESFLWATLWAVLFNEHNTTEPSDVERLWQQSLKHNNRLEFIMFLGQRFYRNASPIAQVWVPILRKFYSLVGELANVWNTNGTLNLRIQPYSRISPIPIIFFSVFIPLLSVV